MDLEHLSGTSEDAIKSFSQKSRSPDRDPKQYPPEYMFRALPINLHIRLLLVHHLFTAYGSHSREIHLQISTMGKY
jgi:hypothetical protein